MKINILFAFIFIILITMIVILLNPQLNKNINIFSSSGILLTQENNIQNAKEHIENTKTATNREIETQNIDNFSQTDLEIQDKSQPLSREEYMLQLKERAQNKYAEFLKNKQQVQKARDVDENETAEQTGGQYTTTQSYKPQIEIYTPKTQTTKATSTTTTTPKKYTNTQNKPKQIQTEKPKTQSAQKSQQQKTATTSKVSVPQSKITKTQTSDVLKSNDVESALKTYLSENLKFPSGYVFQVMFMFDKNLTISGIHITSITEKDYYDGNDSYAYRFYYQPDEKILNNKVYSGNTNNGENKAVAASATPDGEFILELYGAIKKLGKSFVNDIPTEKESEFYSVAINYFANNLYITVTQN